MALLCLVPLAAQKPGPKQHPAIGLQAGYFAGTPKFKNLENTSFDAYSGISYGLFARLHIKNGYFVQPEINLLKREIRGVFFLENGGSTPLRLDQKITDIGLLVHKAFGKKSFRPFAALGMSLGFFSAKKDREIFDPGPGLTYQLEFRSDDTNGILEAGAELDLPLKAALTLAGRYYLAGNNIRFYNSHSANLNRWQLGLSLAKYF